MQLPRHPGRPSGRRRGSGCKPARTAAYCGGSGRPGRPASPGTADLAGQSRPPGPQNRHSPKSGRQLSSQNRHITAAGQRIAFIGSLNESKPAWIAHTEPLSVYRSWDDTNAYLQPYADEFETYWNNGDESSRILPLPEALHQQLIDFAPERNPAGPPLVQEPGGYYSTTAAREELWAAIRYAVTHAPQTTLETIAAELWPHQLSFWRRHARDAPPPPVAYC